MICGPCHGLSGPAQDAPPGTTFRNGAHRYVECACEKAMPWEAHHVRPDTDPQANHPHHRRGGYPEWGPMLCWTCAAELVFDHSQWTVFHCDDCKQRVVELNTRAQKLVVVFGKHSIMNSSSIRSEPITQDPDEILDILDGVRASYGLHGRWVRRRTLANLIRADLPTNRDVPVRVYIGAAAERGAEKEQAFRALLTFFASESQA